MRECGSCTACCTWLVGDAYGHSFGNGKPCKFVCNKGCSIHRIRPETCMKYQCAWSQNLFDYDLRPDKCGVLASVENGKEGQYLRLTFIQDDINTSTLEYFKTWSIKMDAPVVYLKNNIWETL